MPIVQLIFHIGYPTSDTKSADLWQPYPTSTKKRKADEFIEREHFTKENSQQTKSQGTEHETSSLPIALQSNQSSSNTTCGNRDGPKKRRKE